MTSLWYLSIEVSDTPTRTCVRLAGVADFGVRDQLAGALEGVLARTPAVVEVDVAALRLLDASVISVLVQMQERARQVGCDLVVANPQGSVARVLTVPGVPPGLVCHDGPTSTRPSSRSAATRGRHGRTAKPLHGSSGSSASGNAEAPVERPHEHDSP